MRNKAVLALMSSACLIAAPLRAAAAETPPGSTNAYALIMTIGDYAAPVPKLKGVTYDGGSAARIAQEMGVPSENIRTLKDSELTLEGIRKAMNQLESQLNTGSQVFIYYSGHGGRQMVEESGVSRCAEMLITVDGQGYLDAEFEAQLKRISARAQKTIVLLDACHSGGVTTRSVKGNAAYQPKSYSPDAQSCTQVSNVITRGVGQTRTPGSGSGNFVYIAAARDTEISLDQPGRGGVATQAWLGCMGDPSQDRDGSGAITAEEIRACAQERIDTQLSNAKDVLPHHVSITGNKGIVLSYAKTTTPAPMVTAAPAAASTPPSSPTAPTGKPPATQPPAPTPMATLNDIYNNRDDRKLVNLTTGKPQLKIGKDAVDLTLSSREGGYAYLLMVGSDGKTFDLLFPNQLDQDNRIEAGGVMRLPRPAWQFSLDGPPGKDWLLAIVSDTPKDFAQAGLQASGPFSSVSAPAGKNIQLVTDSGRNPANNCGDSQTFRNISIQKKCQSTYGAALLMLEEVQ